MVGATRDRPSQEAFFSFLKPLNEFKQTGWNKNGKLKVEGTARDVSPLGNDEEAAWRCLWSQCLAAEESYWEIFPSIERNISPKGS